MGSLKNILISSYCNSKVNNSREGECLTLNRPV